jgi:crotonobetainyl-CoA:carnitine CoA-transferase CaiB-like acyl-CoA transferase
MDCDVSLYDVAVSLLTYPATWHLNRGWEPTRTARSAHPSLVPFQLFRGSDGVWFLVGCAKEKFWQRVCEVIGSPELADDSRFRSFADRSENRETLVALLDHAFAAHPGSHWIEALRGAGVPTGPVQDVAAAVRDEQTAARSLIAETEHPRFGSVRQLVSPVRVGDPAQRRYRRAPHRNEDFDHVLHSLLGYDAGRVDQLTTQGAFGT